MSEIRWYFNEYPNDTFGDAKTRADTVETGLKALGQLLFQAAFGSSDESKLLLNKAVGSEPPRLAIVSSRPEFLSIPWELMNGGEDTYLASRFSGISRRLSSGPIESFTAELPIDQLNVLLLLPPTGEGSGSVATEVLSALESLAVSAELDCLRPSTATSLREQLTRQPGHYHLVHLDGFTITSKGVIFEDGSGGTTTVDAADLAETLNGTQTPVLLINASSSSALNDVMSFASGLIQNGVPQLVVAPLPIAGAGRVLFCSNFFKGLSGGASVAQTVATVRQAMVDHPQRPSATGPLVSWDWTLPVVFESKEYAPAAIFAEEVAPLAPGQPQPEEETAGTELPRAVLTD